MAATQLLPQAFWFRLNVPCPRLDRVPKLGEAGRLLDLPPSCKLLNAAELEADPVWSEVRAAWNPQGLAFQIEVTGKVGAIKYDPYFAETSDGVLFWIDTRDTRDIHRATRFCHRFAAILKPVRGLSKGVEVVLEQKSIHRSLADAPVAKTGSVLSRVETFQGGWRLELFFKAESLHGFDPDTNRRLGLAYQINDPTRGSQFLTVGRDFPIAEDPSLWATLELVDREAQ